MPIVRVTFTGLAWGSINCQNVCAFSANAANYPTLAAIAAELRDGWCTLLAVEQNNSFVWKNIGVYEVGSGLASFNLPIVVPGQNIQGPLDGTQVVCMKFRILTATGGRQGRGRIYLPGFRAAYIQQGQLTTTGITQMTPRLNAIKARHVGIELGPTKVILGVLPRGDDPSKFKFSTDLSLSIIPGVQRRRSIGLGI